MKTAREILYGRDDNNLIAAMEEYASQFKRCGNCEHFNKDWHGINRCTITNNCVVREDYCKDWELVK